MNTGRESLEVKIECKLFDLLTNIFNDFDNWSSLNSISKFNFLSIGIL